MIGYIIISHGPLAKGLFESTQFFCGELENISFLTLEADDNPLDFQFKIEALYNKIKSDEGVIILTDIPGGSTTNQALMVAQRHDDIRIISGANLMMMIEASFGHGHASIDELCDILVKRGKESIAIAKINDALSHDNDMISEF